MASISLVQKKTDQAVEELKECIRNISTSSSSTIGSRLALAQLRIKDGRLKDAIAILEEYVGVADDRSKFQCGLVSLLAWLYGKTGQSEKSINLMQDAIEFWKSIESGGDMVQGERERE